MLDLNLSISFLPFIVSFIFRFFGGLHGVIKSDHFRLIYIEHAQENPAFPLSSPVNFLRKQNTPQFHAATFNTIRGSRTRKITA